MKQSLPWILASQSPRRRQLLEQAGFTFSVIAPDESVETGGPQNESTENYVARLARSKAENVAEKLSDVVPPTLIIACDTVADCDGVILEKPRDRQHARQMLELLSGRRHEVLSGLCLWHFPSGRHFVEVAKSELAMRPLSNEMLEDYLDSHAWMGKSGAFGFQDDLPWLELTSGSASNVVGLPMELLAEMLHRLEGPR